MNESARVLIVDDDASIRSMLREYLEGHGYAVGEAGSGTQMRECIDAELPDVVLLDIRLPGEDGLTLAKYLRERYDVGIIMVTAAGEMVDRVVGLEVGADDYLAKPFATRELLARLKSVLRRIQAKPAAETGKPLDRHPRASVSGAASWTSTHAACSRAAVTRSRSRRWSSTCCASSSPTPTACCRVTSS